MKKYIASSILGLACLGAAATASAQSTVLFDNLSVSRDGVSPVGTINNPMMPEMNGIHARAQGFMTGTQDLTLESINLSFATSDSSGGFGLHLYDSTGSGNAPGSLLLTLDGNSSPSDGLFAYTGAFDLAPNTLYWLVADVSSDFSSSVYGVNVTASAPTIGSGPGMYSTDGGADWESMAPFNLQMQVTAVPTVVPEPSTMALAGLGGLSLLAYRRRK